MPKIIGNTPEKKLQAAIETVGDDLIEDVSTRLLSYLNHADEIALALASHDMGEEHHTRPSYYCTFHLPAGAPKGETKREKAFAKFIRGNWQTISERRLHHESDFEVDNKTEQVRELLITLMAHNFDFYLKDGHGVGMNFVPRMLGIEINWGCFDDSFLHSVFVNKDVAFIDYAALANDGFSAHNSFGGFSQTSLVLSQSRVAPDHRCGFAAFAAS